MIERFQRCVGVKLFRLGRWQAELWICPQGEAIPPHVHERMDSWIVMLAGRMRFERLRDCVWKRREMSWRDCGRAFDVRAGEEHAATVTGRVGVFVNFERWFSCSRITSAAVDFKEVACGL